VSSDDALRSGMAHGVSTESPLPLWERGRVRGLAPAGAENIFRLRTQPSPRIAARCRASPSPCPSPTRGEGTLLKGPSVEPDGIPEPRNKHGSVSQTPCHPGGGHPMFAIALPPITRLAQSSMPSAPARQMLIPLIVACGLFMENLDS